VLPQGTLQITHTRRGVIYTSRRIKETQPIPFLAQYLLAQLIQVSIITICSWLQFPNKFLVVYFSVLRKRKAIKHDYSHIMAWCVITGDLLRSSCQYRYCVREPGTSLTSDSTTARGNTAERSAVRVQTHCCMQNYKDSLSCSTTICLGLKRLHTR
jgi:hypothetical protein